MKASWPSAPGGAPAIPRAKIAPPPLPAATAAFSHTASPGKSASIPYKSPLIPYSSLLHPARAFSAYFSAGAPADMTERCRWAVNLPRMGTMAGHLLSAPESCRSGSAE